MNFATNTVYSDLTALFSVKTTAVTGLEGQTFFFRCDYPNSQQSNAKYFCLDDDNMSSSHLIRTDKHNEWVNKGRFSLYDNTTEAFFTVRMDKLIPEDSGMYRCGVDDSSSPDHISYIHLDVSQGTVYHVIGSYHHIISTVINYVTFINAHHIKMCIIKSFFLVDGYFHR